MCFWGFLIAFSLTFVMTPIVRKFAFFCGALDYPSARRVNEKPMPHLGGVAIYIGTMVGLLYVMPWTRSTMGIMISGSFLLIVGVIDDRISLPPLVKLFCQILAACILIPFGVQIHFITNPWGGMFYLGILGIPFTILWLVSIVNMVNFIDGLDGLATGVVAIAAITLAIVGFQEGQLGASAMSLVIAGSALAFLFFNFYPARIFMGDAGAMFLGFILAATSVLGALKSATAMTLVIPILALGVPVFDLIFAILRRSKNGHSIASADRDHIHHRLLKLGFSHRRAVLTVYGTSIFLGIVAILINTIRGMASFWLLIFILVAFVFGAWRIGLLRKSENIENEITSNTN